MEQKNVEMLAQEIDAAVVQLLGPLRTSKVVNESALVRLSSALDRLAVVLEPEPLVPKKLVGALWFIVTSMLSEADHARDLEQRQRIEAAAWDVAERLRRVFGPAF